MLKSLRQTWQDLTQNGFPPKIIEQAIADNSWFTPFYIQKSMESMEIWLEEGKIEAFLIKYAIPKTSSPKEIGIIAAGNVPLVAWQDILIVVLSGNVAIVKLSHQDKVIIPYIVDKWISYCPEIAKKIHFVPKIAQVDALIATGSNATATQIDATYQNIPKILRRNRFSVAVLGKGNSANIAKLAEDILLYNGLGCRNVSNIIIEENQDLHLLIDVLENYPSNLLSKNYLQKIKYEKARLLTLNRPFIDAKNALLVFVNELQASVPGIIHLLLQPKDKDVLAMSMENIQCIVGKDIAYGNAQYPDIEDFADGIDTMQWLLTGI